MILPLQVSLEYLEYYSSDRGKDEPPKDINYVLVEWNYFLKPQIKMKSCLILIYIQELLSDIEEIIKDSMFQRRLYQLIEIY